jgi:hypothetical protein
MVLLVGALYMIMPRAIWCGAHRADFVLNVRDAKTRRPIEGAFVEIGRYWPEDDTETILPADIKQVFHRLRTDANGDCEFMLMLGAGGT